MVYGATAVRLASALKTLSPPQGRSQFPSPSPEISACAGHDLATFFIRNMIGPEDPDWQRSVVGTVTENALFDIRGLEHDGSTVFFENKMCEITIHSDNIPSHHFLGNR